MNPNLGLKEMKELSLQDLNIYPIDEEWIEDSGLWGQTACLNYNYSPMRKFNFSKPKFTPL